MDVGEAQELVELHAVRAEEAVGHPCANRVSTLVPQSTHPCA